MNDSDFYFWISFSLAFISTVYALFLFSQQRWIIIKPTFVVSIVALLNSWASVSQSDFIHGYLLYPIDYLIINQFVPLLLLIVSSILFRTKTKQVWLKIKNLELNEFLVLKRVNYVIFSLSIICISVYFLYISPSKTGLWVAITQGDSILSRDSREESLKLLPALPRYIFSFNREVLARFGGASLILVLISNWVLHKRRSMLIFFVTSGILFFAITASLYGARAPGGLVIASSFLVYYLYRGAPLNLGFLIKGLLIILLFPMIISMIRSDIELTVQNIFDIALLVIERVTSVGVTASVWHMDYVQRHGFWGIAGIDKLANMFGIAPSGADNFLMNYYFKDTETGNLTVNAFVTNYTNFGLFFGVFGTIILFSCLDMLILFYKKI